MEVIGAIKLEPSIIKLEPAAVEIRLDDVFQSSDEENDDTKIDLGESGIAEVELKEEDCLRDNDFCATENLKGDERLVLNFNKQVTNNEKSKKSSDNEQINWAYVYRTSEGTNCREELKKTKKVYGSDWSRPIQPEEVTYVSKKSMICNYCDREFSYRKNLAKHIRTQHRESSITYCCPYCPKKSKWSLKGHILDKHKDESEIKWFQCYQCDRKYRAKRGLRKHIQTHLGIEKERVACPTCGRTFSNKTHMQIHARRYHEGKGHRCDKCSFVGMDLSSLKYHIQVCHTDHSELPIHQCSKCDFKTKYKNSYSLHCRKHDITYVCDKCAFKTNTSVTFNLHINGHAAKDNPENFRYHCKKCDYKTHRPYNLQIHELNHLKPEDIKYFYCYHCDFKAKRKDNLKTHVLRHFKKEDVTFQCFMCDFETKKRSALRKHLKSHQKPPQIKQEA